MLKTMFEPIIGSNFILLWSFLAAVCQSGKHLINIMHNKNYFSGSCIPWISFSIMVFSKLFQSWLRFLTRDTFLVIISSKFSSLLFNPDWMDYLSHASFDSSFRGYSLEYLNSNGGCQYHIRRTWCGSWIWFNRRYSLRISIQVYISVRPTAHIPISLQSVINQTL